MLLHRVFLFPVMEDGYENGLSSRPRSRGAEEAPGGHRGKKAAGLGCGRTEVRFENVPGGYVAEGGKPCRWGFFCPTSEGTPSAQPPHQLKVLGRVGGPGGGITLPQKGFPSPGTSRLPIIHQTSVLNGSLKSSTALLWKTLRRSAGARSRASTAAMESRMRRRPF